VLLHINNTLGDVPARLVSKDVIGGSGYDIQCYEFTLPAGDNTIELVSLNPTVPGKYTLGRARITYALNGREYTVESGELEVEVAGKEPAVRQESVTTIYQCGGQSMQYTSTQTTGTQAKEQNQQQSSQQDMDNRMQQSQMSQDSQALKQQMQNEQKAQEQRDMEFEEQLSKSRELQDMARQMIEQGYKPKSKDISAESPDTGQFQYDFQKGNMTQSIEGAMESGNITSLKSTLDEGRLKEMLEQNPEYRAYKEQLLSQGYNMSAFDYSSHGNTTQAKASFRDASGQTANISAKITNTTVTDVKLETENGRWWLWLIPLAFIAGIALLLAFRQKPVVHAVSEEKPFDYRSEAKKLLDHARKSFEAKEYKEAYGKAGESIRLFYSWELGIKKELTSTETISALKRHKRPYAPVQKALSLCGLVEFAKYQPNRKDFEQISSVAEELLR
jgi:hypothetical protein